VRGESRQAKKDGIYRANLRGDSTYINAQAEAVAGELRNGNVRAEIGKHKLAETHRQVDSGWRNLAINLAEDGHKDLARDVQLFVERMPPARTENELIAARFLERAREHEVSR
jgi:hypothetical protein